MRKILTTLFLCHLMLALLATTGKGDAVTIDQLKSSEHHLEPEAPAAYMINNASMEFDLSTSQGALLRTTYHYRIKVYNDEGEDYTQFEIRSYASGGKKERVGTVKAFTYNDVGGQIQKTKLEKTDVFREQTDDNWTTTKFAMPKVKAGSIIDVKYTITSPYYWMLDRFYFQKFIPVDKAMYEIGVPEFFKMSPVPKGYTQLETSSSSNQSNGYGETRYKYEASDVQSITDDDYVLNVNDYRGSVKYEIMAYEVPGRTREVFTGSWKNIGQKMMDDGIGGSIGKHGKLYNSVIASLKGTTAEEKVTEIYSYVRDNYKWNGRYGVYPSMRPKEFMEKRVGNIGDINILLLNLMRNSGLWADPVVTRTRHSGILNMSFPSQQELNYIMVQTMYNGKPLLLDASSRYMQMGQLPIRAVNISGIAMNESTGGKAIEITNANELNHKIVGDFTIDLENNVVNGVYQAKLSKFGAIKYRQEQDDKNEEIDEDNQDLEGEDEDEEEEEEEVVQLDNEITMISSEGVENTDAPISYEYNEVNYKIMSRIGDEIFIDADFDLGIKKNPFTDEVREYPTFFNYRHNFTKVAKLKIPEGYDLTSVPENVSLSLPDKLGKFRYITAVKDDVLTVQYVFRINRDFFLSQQYPALKQMFNMVIAKQNEKIVLSKSGM